MSAVFLRKYNTLLVTGTTAIRIPIIKRGAVDFAIGADWTPAAGDVKIRIDNGAVANVTNLPSAIVMGNTAEWEFILTAAELSGKQITVTVADAAAKAVEDQMFIVETFGNASAMYQADFTLPNLPANVTQLLGTAWLAPAVAGTPDVNAKSVASGAINRAAFSADSGMQTVRSNTAQAGTTTTITLDAGASSTNDFYQNCLVYITGGTGVGQARYVASYVGSTRVATVSNPWKIAPDATSIFAVIESDTLTVSTVANVTNPVTLAAASLDAILRTALPESYAADGASATMTQLLYEIAALLQEVLISGTSLQTFKRDGVTPAAGYTLNNAATPTAITRTS